MQKKITKRLCPHTIYTVWNKCVYVGEQDVTSLSMRASETEVTILNLLLIYISMYLLSLIKFQWVKKNETWVGPWKWSDAKKLLIERT